MVMPEYDNNLRGGLWSQRGATGTVEVNGTKYYATLIHTGRDKPKYKLFLEHPERHGRALSIAMFPGEKQSKKIAGGQVEIADVEYWVTLFKNDSDAERSPTLDIVLQRKDRSGESASKDEWEDEDLPF